MIRGWGIPPPLQGPRDSPANDQDGGTGAVGYQLSGRGVTVNQLVSARAAAHENAKCTWLVWQLPGVGFVVAMTVLAAVGDISRFENASKLVGYAGLGAGVHDSGKTHKEKKITKKGRRELRWALVEAAWRAVGMSPFWKTEYEKHLERMRKPNQAIVVIARKLLIAIWHVLSKEETDIHATEEDLAYKMLLLSWSLGDEVRQGLTYKQFAKYALMQLGVEADITGFVRKNVRRRLAPREEVLARMTELGLSA